MKKLSWKARRIGDQFCSPACGHGCSFVAYELAVQESKKLAKELGKGWRPVVWENLGWHWKAAKPYFSVHGMADHYSVYLDTDRDSGAGLWCADAKTPHAAVRKVIRKVHRELGGLTRFFEKIEGVK